MTPAAMTCIPLPSDHHWVTVPLAMGGAMLTAWAVADMVRMAVARWRRRPSPPNKRGRHAW